MAEFTRKGLERAGSLPPLPDGLNLRREFRDRSIRFPQPGEAEIRAILAKLGKTGPEDELNCGACGYLSCREKAIAVYGNPGCRFASIIRRVEQN